MFCVKKMPLTEPIVMIIVYLILCCNNYVEDLHLELVPHHFIICLNEIRFTIEKECC